MKKCTRCNLFVNQDDLGHAGKGYWCKKCVNEYQRSWSKSNPIKRNEYARKGWLRRNYGMTVDDFRLLLTEQGGRCAICGTDRSGQKSKYLHVDHCHKTKKVRGLLCDLCNRGLGYFRDESGLLLAAAKYLKKHEI